MLASPAGSSSLHILLVVDAPLADSPAMTDGAVLGFQSGLGLPGLPPCWFRQTSMATLGTVGIWVLRR